MRDEMNDVLARAGIPGHGDRVAEVVAEVLKAEEVEAESATRRANGEDLTAEDLAAVVAATHAGEPDR
jgi:hypothetical protein